MDRITHGPDSKLIVDLESARRLQLTAFFIFVRMANKLKKSTPKAPEKPAKTEKTGRSSKASSDKLKAEREEKLDLKKLAKDERTWKIIGTVSLLISIFLFIAFVSYLFTWKEDQSQVMNKNISFLFDNDADNKVSNLLGRLGAFTSHNLIYSGFGLAAFLFCTFFFVVGINLLFNRRVFSIWRNLKYVTFGLLIASVSFAFIFPKAFGSFPWGGEVGNMISAWLVNFLGTIGTAFLLLVVAGSYLIWQFNPSFNLPQRDERQAEVEVEEQKGVDITIPDKVKAGSVNDMYADGVAEKGNLLKGDATMVINSTQEEKDNGLRITEKDEREEEFTITETIVEKEIVADLLHTDDFKSPP